MEPRHKLGEVVRHSYCRLGKAKGLAKKRGLKQARPLETVLNRMLIIFDKIHEDGASTVYILCTSC